MDPQSPPQDSSQQQSPVEASGPSFGEIPVYLDPPPLSEAPTAPPPVDDSEATAATAAEIISGLFQVAGGKAVDYSHVEYALSDDEKKAFAAALAPLLRKYGMTALPFPEEMGFLISATGVTVPRVMKWRQDKRKKDSAGISPELEGVAADGNRNQFGKEGDGQVNAAPSVGLGVFAGPPTRGL